MRDHSKASAAFWTGETGRALRGDPRAQVMAFYLFTCPASNMIGMYYLPMPQICHETGMTKEGASKALRRGEEVLYAAYDYQTEHVFVYEMARYQLGERLKLKDNRRTGVLRLLAGLTKCPFYNDFLRRYNEPFLLGLEPVLQAPSRPPSKPLGSPLEGTTSPSPSLMSSSSGLLFSSEEKKDLEVLGDSENGVGDAKKIPPRVEWVHAYCAAKGITIDVDKFMLTFGRQGWKLSNGNAMKDWQMSVLHWHRIDQEKFQSRQGPGQSHPEDQKRVPGKL